MESSTVFCWRIIAILSTIVEIRQIHSNSKMHAIQDAQPPSCRDRDRQAAAIKGPDIDNYPFLRACAALAPLDLLSVSFFVYFLFSDSFLRSFPSYDHLCARTSTSATPYADGDKDFNSWNENCRSI